MLTLSEFETAIRTHVVNGAYKCGVAWRSSGLTEDSALKVPRATADALVDAYGEAIAEIERLSDWKDDVIEAEEDDAEAHDEEVRTLVNANDRLTAEVLRLKEVIQDLVGKNRELEKANYEYSQIILTKAREEAETLGIGVNVATEEDDLRSRVGVLGRRVDEIQKQFEEFQASAVTKAWLLYLAEGVADDYRASLARTPFAASLIERVMARLGK